MLLLCWVSLYSVPHIKWYPYCYYAECHYAESQNAKCHNAKCDNSKCHNAKCHHSQCWILNVLLIAIMLGVVMLNIIMLIVITLSVAFLNVLLLYWMSLCWMSICWMSICWMALCWMALCWMTLCCHCAECHFDEWTYWMLCHHSQCCILNVTPIVITQGVIKLSVVAPLISVSERFVRFMGAAINAQFLSFRLNHCHKQLILTRYDMAAWRNRLWLFKITSLLTGVC